MSDYPASGARFFLLYLSAFCRLFLFLSVGLPDTRRINIFCSLHLWEVIVSQVSGKLSYFQKSEVRSHLRGKTKKRSVWSSNGRAI